MFKRCSLLLTLAVSSLVADCNPGPGQFEVDLETIYMKPSVDDTYFVMKSPVTTTYPNGKRENNDFDYDLGFRACAAYGFCDCNRDISVTYTQLRSKEDKTVLGSFLWGTVGRPDVTSNFENFIGSASSKIHSRYERLDTLVEQQLMSSCGLELYGLFGLEATNLRLHEEYRYQITAGSLGTVNQKSRTWGIGPQLGISLDYEICQCSCLLPGTLTFVSSSSSSLLVAKTHTSSFETYAGDTLLDTSDKNTTRVVPALHLNLGLNYTGLISCYHYDLELGYEFNSYLRGLARTGFVDDVADSLSFTNYYNYDVHGLYAAVKIRF